jgi:hypothetical protein
LLAKQSLPSGNPNRLFAVGKYQVIPITMKSAIKALNLDTSQKFTPQLQEFVFRNFLIGVKRPQVKAFVASSGTSTRAAQLALAQEFASVANPDSPSGASFYAGSANNRASITKAATIAALRAEQQLYKELLKQNSPADAWTKLSAS